MKILFLTDGIYPFVLGGMQKHATYVLKQFAAAGYEITLVTTASHVVDEHKLAKEVFDGEIPGNVSLHFVPYPQLFPFPGHYIASSWQYSKRISQNWAQRLKEFDLVYSKGFTAWHLLKNTAKRNTPVVIQLHGLEMFQPAYGVKDRLVKKLLRIPAKSVIANSDYIFSYGGKIKTLLQQLGVEERKILEQYGAVDDFWLQPEPEINAQEMPEILFVARYEFRKGHHLMHQALQQLSDEGIKMPVHIVGEVPAEKRLALKHIHYLGNRNAEHIKDLADRCSVILLPSLAEGFPTILVEAMARGLAPVATDVGAVAAVVNEKNGWLLKSPEASLIANALREVYQNQAILKQKRHAAYQTVFEYFQWKSMFEALVSHLRFIRNDYGQRNAGKKP